MPLIIFGWIILAAVCIGFVFWGLSKAQLSDPVRVPVTLLVVGIVIVASLFAFVGALQRAGLLAGL